MIRWTTERVLSWRDDEFVEQEVQAAARWRLRAISNRSSARPLQTDFDAILARSDQDLILRIRSFGTGSGPYATEARAGGTSLAVLANITLGVKHEAKVRIKPSDDSIARWSCTCGTSSRGPASPEAAREAAEAHVLFAPDAQARPRDRAVAQGPDGRWAQADVAVAQRFRTCVRSEVSASRSHLAGVGEDFEIAVDGRLGLWVRKLGSEAALRKDDDGRGVSLLAFDRDG